MLRQNSFIPVAYHQVTLAIIGKRIPITSDIIEYSSTNIPSKMDELIASLYQSIISTRMDLMDKRRGIQSNRYNIANGKNSFWLRIIGSNNENSPEEIKERKRDFLYNYLRLFYAYLLGAISIEIIYPAKNNDKLVQEILELKKSTFTEFNSILNNHELTLEECEHKVSEVISHKKHALIKLLKQRLASNALKHSGFRGNSEIIIGKMLDQAKDWVALEQPSIPIYTVIETDDKYFNKKRIVIVDQPCTIVTEEQKALIRNRRNEKWYKELLPFQKQLVEYHADRLLEDRVIPSQLRSVVPLGKNSFCQSIYIERDDETFEELNSYFHSGTAAYLSHKNNDTALQITKLNLMQQKVNAGADVSIMIALNSSMADAIVGTREKMLGRAYTADDSKIIELTAKAADSENGLLYSKICLNGFRKLEKNDYSGIEKIIAIIQANIDKINNETNAEIKIMLQLINEIKLLMKGWAITEKDIIGTEIIYKLSKLSTLNNNLKFITDVTTIAVWFGCASGENRTGLSYYHNITQTLIDYCKSKGVELAKDDIKHILNMVANSEHIHIMTGNQGSTFGTEGIRGKSKGSANADYPVDELVTNIADAKAITSTDEVFDAALADLQSAIAANLNNPFVSSIIDYAEYLYEYAKSQRQKIADKEIPDNEIHLFAEALTTTGTLLKDFKSENLNKLTDCLYKINPTNDSSAITPINTSNTKTKSHPIFHSAQRSSWKMIVGGCLLGIAAVALTAFSIMAAVSTFGIATPLSALGLTLSFALAAKAIAITAAVASTSTLCLSSFFVKKGAEKHNNITKNLTKICSITTNKLAH